MKFCINNFFVSFILLCCVQSAVAVSLWSELSEYQPPEEKKFVIIICSCNNAKFYENNLTSAFMQDYPRDKYRVIYVDESRDGTADLVEDYIASIDARDRFTLIKNEKWQSLIPNHYKAAYLCEDDEIIVHLDGDDMLKHEKVLYLLNKAYNRWDIWLTYGQYENWPIPELGFSTEVPEHLRVQNCFREFGFWYSHPRTFYAWLFKKIKLKDLIWKGSFIPTLPAIDVLFMFPMMEMAGQGHYKFISDSLYLYNRTNALSTCNMPIKLELPPARSWEKYQPLTEKDNKITEKRLNKGADLVVLSFDNPDALNSFIAQELSEITHVETVLILYRASSEENKTKYQDLKLPENMIMVDSNDYSNGKCFDCLANDYCLIIADPSIHLNECPIKECVYELERTDAKAFFLGLSKESFQSCNEKINYGPFPDLYIEYRLAFLSNGIAAWQFEYEPYVWDDAKLTAAVILRRNDITNNAASLIQEFTIDGYKKTLRKMMNLNREIGLLFEDQLI